MYDVFSRFGASSTGGQQPMTSDQYQAKREESTVSPFAARR